MKTQRWQVAVAIGLGVGEAIVVSSVPVFAQSVIVPDGTLGAERSQVLQNATLNGQPITTPINGVRRPIEAIIGGARRGNNLFHSFSELNVNADRGAFFVSPDNQVRNILARVTGRNSSKILGRLGTFQVVNGSITSANANLFLINPNGIVFGPNASLGVGGSFMATTAHAVQFGDRGRFSATNPSVPSAVLTIDPSAFLFEAISAQPILNQSRATNPSVPSFIDGLRVSDGRSLLLLGGNVIFDGGVGQARGGRIEIGGLMGSGKVDLTVNGNNLDLNFPGNITLANVNIRNGALLETSGIANTPIQTGGEVQIQSTNFTLANNSNIHSDTSGDQTGGTISIRASQVELRDRANITANTNGSGSSGNVEVEANVLRMQNFSQIQTGTAGGKGNGGQITIWANQSIDLLDNAQFGSLTVGRGDQVGLGNAGNIFVRTGNLNIQNASGMISSTYIGDGNAGNIDIQATNINLLNSNLFTSSVGVGAGGAISVKTETLSIKQGSSIQTSTFDVSTFDFNSLSGNYPPEIIAQIAALRATVPPNRLGRANSGNLSIEATDSVEVTGISTNRVIRSQISTATFGSGSGGELNITTGSLRIAEGGLINSSSGSFGRGGNLNITARESIDLVGVATLADGSTVSSGLLTGTFGIGVAGTLRLETGRLMLREGGQILASTTNAGQAGDAIITADSIQLVGISTNRLRSSAIVSQSDFGATGNAGNVLVSTRTLSVRDGGVISTATFGQGRGGNLDITARESTDVVGTARLTDGSTFSSRLSTATTGDGTAGTLRLETGQLRIVD